MRVLGVIPARGGSKGIPRKNLADIAGKPLLQYTIDSAVDADSRLSPVVVSTEDDEIAAVAESLGAQVPFLRPEELSSDTAPSIDVVRHAVEQIEHQMELTFDWVMLLQPTTPFRSSDDIVGALDLAGGSDCDSVISVFRAFDSHPARIKRIVDGYLEPFCVPEEEGTRRQDLEPPAYARNGAIYLTRRDVVMSQGTIWGQRMRAYEMPEKRSINIDTPLDLEVARALAASEAGR